MKGVIVGVCHEPWRRKMMGHVDAASDIFGNEQVGKSNSHTCGLAGLSVAVRDCE
jgi:hypothetical protein